LQRSEAIERDANRLDELKSVLPPLEYSVGERDQMQLASAREKQCREAAQRGDQKIDEAKTVRDALQNEIEAQREKQAEEAETREAASARLLQIAPVLQAQKEIESLQIELRNLELEMGNFAPDLDAQIQHEHDALTETRQAQTAFSPLSRLANAREKRRDAQREYSLCHQKWLDVCAGHEKLKEEYSALQKTQAENETDLQAARDNATQKATLLQQIRAQITRFQQVENDSSCHYCGQKLTPAHRVRESERLQNETAKAQHEEKTAREALKAAVKIQAASGQNAQSLQEKIEVLYETARGAKERKKSADREIETALQTVLVAWRELPEEFAFRAMENGAQNGNDENSTVEAILESGSYPTPSDLQAIREQAKSLATREKKIANIQVQLQQRATKAALIEKSANRFNELQREYSLSQRQQAQIDERKSKQQLNVAARQMNDIVKEIAGKTSTLQTIQKELHALEKAGGEAVTEAAIMAERQKEIARMLGNTKAQLPESWREFFEIATREKIESLQKEESELEKMRARELRAELQSAREQENIRREQAEQLARDINEIPIKARRDVAELENEAAQIKSELDEKAGQHAKAQSEYSGLEDQRAQRQKIEEQLAVAETGARRHKLLADALGREGLQRRLLREAENIITDAANGILDRISGGTLRLELKAEEVSNARGKSKALDLVAYNSLSSETQEATALAFLSGSQRFRVAVALALGIGHYATQGHARRAEAVIIDEGFGSLDKQGLREIIEELHGLQSVLKRVILVSHQDEFAHAFSNRYLIELENGTSRATLQQVTGEELLL